MEDGSGAAAAGGGLVFIIQLVLIVLMVVAMWKIFTKAGKPGWASIIPIYNVIVLLEIVGRPLWWIILFFIPIANIVVAIMVCVDLAARFGKGAGYVVGLILLPIVFLPMLAFGSAQYSTPAAPAAPAEPAAA